MNPPEASGQDSKKRLHDLGEAIDQLQEKLEALGRSLKEIKNALEKPKEEKNTSASHRKRKNECVALPYLFVS